MAGSICTSSGNLFVLSDDTRTTKEKRDALMVLSSSLDRVGMSKVITSFHG